MCTLVPVSRSSQQSSLLDPESKGKSQNASLYSKCLYFLSLIVAFIYFFKIYVQMCMLITEFFCHPLKCYPQGKVLPQPHCSWNEVLPGWRVIAGVTPIGRTSQQKAVDPSALSCLCSVFMSRSEEPNSWHKRKRVWRILASASQGRL